MKMNDKIRDAIENYEGTFRMKDLSGMLGLFTEKEKTQVKNIINRLFMKGKVTKVGRGLYKYNGVPASPEGYAVASPDEGYAVASGDQVNEQGMVVEETPTESCLVDGCEDDAKNRGLCLRHYGIWRLGKLEGFEPFRKGREPAKTQVPSFAKASAGREDKAGKESEKIKVEKEIAFDPRKIVEILKDSRFDKLREELLSAAKDQIRTPEAQMVWYVKRGLNLDEMKATASAVAKTERR